MNAKGYTVVAFMDDYGNSIFPYRLPFTCFMSRSYFFVGEW